MSGQINSLGKISKFDELSHKMLFNISINEPDSLIIDFVKKYFPALTKKRTVRGWTLHPPDLITEYQSIVHSLSFKKHPYFDATFREGRLDILTLEERGGSRYSIEDFHLWLMFDNKKDANQAFKRLVSMFDPLSTIKNRITRTGKKIAEYTDKEIFESWNSIQFILTNDELHDNKYKLLFRIGSFTYTE